MDPGGEEEQVPMQANEYPDPDDSTPRFAWLGAHRSSLLPQHIDEVELGDDAGTNLGRKNSYTFQGRLERDEAVSPLEPRRGPVNPLVDTRFQYEAESDEGNEMISEADSDFDDPISMVREVQTRSQKGGRGNRRSRGRRGLGTSVSRGRGRVRTPKGPGRGGKGVKRGVRKPLDPGQDFKDLHSQATMAFIDQDYEAAEEFAKQAIQSNPEIFTVYSLLSEIHMARGDKGRAVHALFNGAHTRPRDTVLWCQVARLIMDLSGQDKASGVPDAIYCYNRVIGTEPDHIEARYQRAALHREFGSKKKAAYDYVRLLRQLPHDTTVLRHIAEVYIDLGQSTRAIDHYDASIAHFQSIEPFNVTKFTWSDLNIYAELYMYLDDIEGYASGLLKIKNYCRWMLNRVDEQFWDLHNVDDREFDDSHHPRRVELPEFQPDKHDIEAYGKGLPIELRIRLGQLRVQLGPRDIDEAIAHFEWLEPDVDGAESRVFNFPDLFREVADTFRTHGLYHMALRFYEPLQQIENHADSLYYSNMGDCFRALEMYNEAEDCFRVIVENDEGDVEALLRLATMFEKADMPDRAAPYVVKIVALRREKLSQKEGHELADYRTTPADASRETGPVETSWPLMLDQSAKRTSAARTLKEKQAQKLQKHEQTQLLYGELRTLKEQLQVGNQDARAEWMEIAKILIDGFRKEKHFYPSDRAAKIKGYPWSKKGRPDQGSEEMDAFARPLQGLIDGFENDENPIFSEFCGISFANWLDIFLEYAILLAESGETTSAYEIVAAATNAIVFYHSKDFNFLINVAWFTCALIANDDETICNVARYFMKEYQFVTDSYRLFSALNKLCNKPNIWYNSGPSQKYMLRQIKAMDFTLIGDERLKTLYEEKASYTSKDEEGNPIKASAMDIGLIMLYGHILYTGGSYAYALNYFYRAYALDPQNPMINLSLALGYLHYAIKRQSENRHYLIMQGFSFLFAYYEVRKASTTIAERQEGEFNVGRAYQMLGLGHMAVAHYERCLALGEELHRIGGEAGVEDFSTEAAFALQGLSIASGEVERAQRITERWLII